MGQLAFIPASMEQAKEVRRGFDPGPCRGCAVTPALLRALEPQITTDEAEFAALSNAGVLALGVGSESTRLVLAADVEPAQITGLEDPSGEVTVSSLSWAQVRALFIDEPGAAEAVRKGRLAVAEAAGEVTVAAAMALPEVGKLLDGHDLLWFAPEELDHLGETADPTEIAANRAD